MIPQGLENLILTGKAKADVLTHVGGAFGSIEVNPDKIMILWGITIFPFVDQDADNTGHLTGTVSASIYTLTLNSDGQREVLPFKFAFNDNGTLIGNSIYLPLYSIHRSRVTFDLRRFDVGRSHGTTAAPLNIGEQNAPFGARGVPVVKTIDPLGAAFVPVPFSVDLWHTGTAGAGANNLKFEVPASKQSTLNSAARFYDFAEPVTSDNFPVIHFNCVFANSSNFEKLLVR